MNSRIKEARKAAGLTQAQLGEKVGLSKNYICLIETGDRKPGNRAIADIAAALGVNEAWLRTGEGNMTGTNTREPELLAAARDLLSERDDSFRRRLVSALLKFDPKGPEWAILERIMGNFIDNPDK